MTYKIKMSSKEYGTEEFFYETLAEAKEGLERLKKKARELNDSISRTFELLVDEEKEDEDTLEQELSLIISSMQETIDKRICDYNVVDNDNVELLDKDDNVIGKIDTRRLSLIWNSFS